MLQRCIACVRALCKMHAVRCLGLPCYSYNIILLSTVTVRAELSEYAAS